MALLSRLPLVGAQAVWFWDGGRRGERRGAVVARVRTASGPVACVVAHLSTRRGERRRERRALAGTVAGMGGPVVCFVDANAGRLGPLRRGGLCAPPGRPVATFPADRPSAAVDWILTRAPARHVRRAHAPACDASDHRPLVSVVGC